MSEKGQHVSRRDFIKLAGTVVIGANVTGSIFAQVMAEDVDIVPVSQGYLLVDKKKCDGCLTCMLTCSVVHEGKASLSLSRLQVLQNPLEKFPHDLSLYQCRQCVNPGCIKACPTGALFINEQHGNLRMVDISKCPKDCMACVEACPHKPSRLIWDGEDGHVQLCDLCSNAPHWDHIGGPDGRQACIDVCPMGAISFTKNVPAQEGDTGYVVNLRGAAWQQLGYPID